MKSNLQRHLWSIVLAGGEGERLRPYVERALGHRKPKQYCAFTGKRSMFQHTLDRADRIAPARRRVTVIARSHRAEALSQLLGRESGEIILQPENRDTAAGVLLPLAHVLVRDPAATVIVYPSDHFIYPSDRFTAIAESAASAAELMPGRLVLIAAAPDHNESDYGWLRIGPRHGVFGGHALFAVEGFAEKPGPEEAQRLLRSGALWNTFIFAARAETLWKLCRMAVPDVVEMFEPYRAMIGTPLEESARFILYERMPVRNFSSAVLARFPKIFSVLMMQGVLWSDWGREERISETLRQIGKQLHLPVEIETAESNPRTLSAAV